MTPLSEQWQAIRANRGRELVWWKLSLPTPATADREWIGVARDTHASSWHWGHWAQDRRTNHSLRVNGHDGYRSSVSARRAAERYLDARLPGLARSVGIASGYASPSSQSGDGPTHDPRKDR